MRNPEVWLAGATAVATILLFVATLLLFFVTRRAANAAASNAEVAAAQFRANNQPMVRPEIQGRYAHGLLSFLAKIREVRGISTTLHRVQFSTLSADGESNKVYTDALHTDPFVLHQDITTHDLGLGWIRLQDLPANRRTEIASISLLLEFSVTGVRWIERWHMPYTVFGTVTETGVLQIAFSPTEGIPHQQIGFHRPAAVWKRGWQRYRRWQQRIRSEMGAAAD